MSPFPSPFSLPDYTYDAFNQLVKRVVDPDGASSSSAAIEQTFYLWENGQIVLQFDKTGSGDVGAEKVTATKYR
jgi:hypothetical protein